MTPLRTAQIFLRHLGPERRWIALHVPGVLVCGLMAAAPPTLVGWLVDHLVAHPAHAAVALPLAVAAILVGGLLYMGLVYATDQFTTVVSETVGARFTCELYEHLQRLSADFYQLNRVGELTARLTHDVNRGIRPLYPQCLELVEGGTMLVASGVFLALAGPPLFGIFLVLTLLSLAVSCWAFPRIIRNFELLQNDNGTLNAQITEAVSVHSLVRAFAREDEARARMQPLIDALARQQTGAMRFLSRFLVFIWSFDIVAGPFLILLLGGWLLAEGHTTAGGLVAAVLYWRAASHFKFKVTDGITSVMSGLGAIRRATAFFDETPLVADAPDATALPPGPGRIELAGVAFRYPQQRDAFALGPIDLVIPAGTRCALLGPSGSGKTTIAQLLCRIYDVDAGAIRLDGHDIRGVTQHSLRRRIGFMTQETQLFDGSLRDNLAFAAPGATDDALTAALDRAGLGAFLAALPEGLATLVGERGLQLSGGQRQRLALARLLLLDPEIIILDEPTSALDAATEAAIWQSIEELLAGRTQLVITHRIATALHADQLAILHLGRLEATGTAAELARTSPLFRELCAAQHIDPSAPPAPPTPPEVAS